MDMNTEPSLEFERYEDDVFYAELRRQILFLTAEEEDDGDFLKTKHSNSLGVGEERPRISCISTVPPGNYFNWSETENSNSVPTWILNLWRNGNGTGVFIPHIIKSRRHKPRRKNSDKARTCRQVENKIE
ncbi:hypothetical protein F0562_034011 [Nyssa sinensis]|uniref:Uncharacterized protein n=1 Tax=Nyssa sinensis TaxID=561372 RepID=A0A5J5AF28_9ASTE|nr:hypothetical protein F0562_034011 [Nyssa sinensis]